MVQQIRWSEEFGDQPPKQGAPHVPPHMAHLAQQQQQQQQPGSALSTSQDLSRALQPEQAGMMMQAEDGGEGAEQQYEEDEDEDFYEDPTAQVRVELTTGSVCACGGGRGEDLPKI